MSQFYIDFKKYRDKYGLNQLHTDGTNGEPTQNGVLFTLEYLICLLEDDSITPETKQVEINRVREVLRSCEVAPGLLVRHPGSHEWDSMDNNGAALVFSGLFDQGRFARDMKAHGDSVKCDGLDEVDDLERNKKYYGLASFLSGIPFKPRHFWNNQRPTKFSLFCWYGRSPGFLGLIDMAAGRWTNPLRWISGIVLQFAGLFADKGNADARKLPYVTWYFLTRGTGRGQRWFWKALYKIWGFFLKRQYKGGMKDVYAMYYQDPDHPIRRYSKELFD